MKYTVPTLMPEQLRAGRDRMLAAIVPKGDQVWFFKVTGPEDAITTIESEYREYIQEIEFNEGVPVLDNLPQGWRRGGVKPMRFATIDIETADKQLSVSVSQLGRQDDWDNQVKMNVNRWRGQLGLEPSVDKWADGQAFQVAAADTTSIWVDLVGDPDAAPMSPPFAGGAMASSGAAGNRPGVSESEAQATAATDESPLKYERPEGWRDGQLRGIRIAAFDIGPQDAPAELTVIPAGGNLRDNVARWLGEAQNGEVPDELVDQALADAKRVQVDGRPGQRFLLSGDEKMIDGTIVPIGNGFSLFVKATGPKKTITEQSEAIASFLESLELNL